MEITGFIYSEARIQGGYLGHENTGVSYSGTLTDLDDFLWAFLNFL